MKQIPYAIHTIKELQACVEEVRETSRQLKHLSGVLVSVFMDPTKKAMLEGIQKAIQAVFPEAQVIGSVSSGEIVNGQLLDQGVAVTPPEDQGFRLNNCTIFESTIDTDKQWFYYYLACRKKEFSFCSNVSKYQTLKDSNTTIC